jgi:DNA-3-methyladenine glycosylase II|tara:strand:+ start:262 stop:882 length:621 start_codon:yes stop_codon:yes gene_type:complete
MPMQVGRPDWWGEATSLLSKDPLIGEIARTFDGEGLSGRGEIFQTLVRSIVGQQISVKAADAVHGRLEEMSGGEVTREAIGSLTVDELLSCGLSRQKSQYILGIANDETPLLPDGYEELDDESLIRHLVKFKGIGPWTAEMMLIFSLMRPDVLSLGDLGVVKGIRMLDPQAQSKSEMLAVAEAWRPYRSAACWFLWRSLDPVPVEY